jgi:hypothetical protein
MVRGWILTDREEFDKHFMKYKKPEMCDWMWKIREKNRVLRETFDKHKSTKEKGQCWFEATSNNSIRELWEAVKVYLGEK